MPAKTVSIIMICLASAASLSACASAPQQSRYVNTACDPYACAPLPPQNPCCYPQPVIYSPPPPAQVMALPAPTIEAEPNAAYVAPSAPVEHPVHTAPIVSHGYPEPDVSFVQPLPMRK
jgi:hypothetical protein